MYISLPGPIHSPKQASGLTAHFLRVNFHIMRLHGFPGLLSISFHLSQSLGDTSSRPLRIKIEKQLCQHTLKRVLLTDVLFYSCLYSCKTLPLKAHASHSGRFPFFGFSEKARGFHQLPLKACLFKRTVTPKLICLKFIWLKRPL
jgi:hypothetical protein